MLGKKHGFEDENDVKRLWTGISRSDDGEVKAYQKMKTDQWFRAKDDIVDDIDPFDGQDQVVVDDIDGEGQEARHYDVFTLNSAEEELVDHYVNLVQVSRACNCIRSYLTFMLFSF